MTTARERDAALWDRIYGKEWRSAPRIPHLTEPEVSAVLAANLGEFEPLADLLATTQDPDHAAYLMREYEAATERYEERRRDDSQPRRVFVIEPEPRVFVITP